MRSQADVVDADALVLADAALIDTTAPDVDVDAAVEPDVSRTRSLPDVTADAETTIVSDRRTRTDAAATLDDVMTVLMPSVMVPSRP
jgi:hypothetical protein